jgi:hypothetical protein
MVATPFENSRRSSQASAIRQADPSPTAGGRHSEWVDSIKAEYSPDASADRIRDGDPNIERIRLQHAVTSFSGSQSHFHASMFKELRLHDLFQVLKALGDNI